MIDTVADSVGNLLEFVRLDGEWGHDHDHISQRTQPDTARQGKIANTLTTTFRPHERLTLLTVSHQFDCGNQPALTYVSDVWVGGKWREIIRKKSRFFGDVTKCFFFVEYVERCQSRCRCKWISAKGVSVIKGP